MPDALSSPSVARNREPILAVLKPHLPPSGLVLEIAAGTGEHAVHLAAACPGLLWQPTDPDPAARASITAWRHEAGLPNLLAPLALNASDPAAWPVERADAIVAINMIHISPWSATQGLMAGAGRLLPSGGVLFVYGPYIEADVPTAPSNLAFDASLKKPRSGLGPSRPRRGRGSSAAGTDWRSHERLAMPANNLVARLPQDLTAMWTAATSTAWPPWRASATHRQHAPCRSP